MVANVHVYVGVSLRMCRLGKPLTTLKNSNIQRNKAFAQIKRTAALGLYPSERGLTTPIPNDYYETLCKSGVPANET